MEETSTLEEWGEAEAQEFLRKLETAKREVSIDDILVSGKDNSLGIIFEEKSIYKHSTFGNIYALNLIVGGPREYLQNCLSLVASNEDICASKISEIDSARYEFQVSFHTKGSLGVLARRLEDISEQEKIEFQEGSSYSFTQTVTGGKNIYKHEKDCILQGQVEAVLRAKSRVPPYVDEHVLSFNNEYGSFKEHPLTFYLEEQPDEAKKEERSKETSDDSEKRAEGRTDEVLDEEAPDDSITFDNKKLIEAREGSGS